ncbi:ParA family protein [Geodermatophilus sp. SYSU D00703]
MTDPGQRLRSSLAADQAAGAGADFDSPIAMEALRATRVLHAANQEPFPVPGRIRVITIANQKGGVGKTTSAVNLGVALSLYGLRTLVIDLDPQGNTSTALGVEHTVGTPSVYDALVSDSSLSEVVHPTTASPLLHCVPATIDLAGAEIELVSVVAREYRLRRAIEAHLQALPPEQRPWYVLIDCPPSLGLLTLNALVAGDEVLIPIQCEYYALEGLGQLLNNIDLVRQHLNPSIAVRTILLTMYDARTKLADQVAEEVRNHFGDLVLDAVIPRNVRVSEAPGYGQSVLTYDPGSRGSTSYVEAARELAERGVSLPPLASRTGPGTTAAPPPVTSLAFPDTDAATVPVPPSPEERA